MIKLLGFLSGNLFLGSLMRRFGLGSGLSLLCCIWSCGGVQKPQPGAGLKVVSQPEEALVYVDGKFLASGKTLSRFAEALTIGKHFVTIQAEGYFPHDIEVDLPKGVSTLRIELRPIPQ